MTRPRYTPQQKEFIEDRRDRVAISAGRSCGRTTMMLERAYRASYAGAVLVITPTETEVRVLVKKFQEMFPDTKVREAYSGRYSMHCRHMPQRTSIMVDTYVHMARIPEIYRSVLFQETCFYDPSKVIKENPSLQTLRKGFDPHLDYMAVLDLIHYMSNCSKVISIAGKPIPRDPLFQHISLAPQRWSLHKLGMLQCWWAASQYADLKTEMLKSEGLDKVQEIAAELGGEWRIQ